MRLSDIMSHSSLTTYPIAGLVIFLTIFIAVSVRALSRKRAPEYRRASMMPLSDEAVGPTGTAPRTHSTGASR